MGNLSLVHLTLPPELKRRVRIVAARAELPMTNWIREQIEHAVEQAEREGGEEM